MEFNKVDDLILFSVHQIEPINVNLSVTVTSPAMKVNRNIYYIVVTSVC